MEIVSFVVCTCAAYNSTPKALRPFFAPFRCEMFSDCSYLTFYSPLPVVAMKVGIASGPICISSSSKDSEHSLLLSSSSQRSCILHRLDSISRPFPTSCPRFLFATMSRSANDGSRTLPIPVSRNPPFFYYASPCIKYLLNECINIKLIL